MPVYQPAQDGMFSQAGKDIRDDVRDGVACEGSAGSAETTIDLYDNVECTHPGVSDVRTLPNA